jgi:hypothetical protein
VLALRQASSRSSRHFAGFSHGTFTQRVGCQNRIGRLGASNTAFALIKINQSLGRRLSARRAIGPAGSTLTQIREHSADGHRGSRAAIPLECCRKRSADCSCPPLCLRFEAGLWLHWQLKNRSLLTFVQKRQEHDLPVRKFERIVMGRHPVLIGLPEDRGLVPDRSRPPS